MAFVKHRGVNRDRRRILKALLMKASQYGGAFGLIERPRGCRPHGRDYIGRNVKTFPTIKRSAWDIERHAGFFHAYHRYEFSEPRHHSVSVCGNVRPSNAATFF